MQIFFKEMDDDHNSELTTCELYMAYANISKLQDLTKKMLSGEVQYYES